MSPKTRRPGTRTGAKRAESVGVTGAFERRKPATMIPEDLVDAAEAALDDLLHANDNAFSADEPSIHIEHDIPEPAPAPAATAAKDADFDEGANIHDMPPRRAQPPAPPAKRPAIAPLAESPRVRARTAIPVASADVVPDPFRRAPPRVASDHVLDRSGFAGSRSAAEGQRGESIDEGQLVDETKLPELATLRFAVFEEATHLTGAKAAVIAAGHEVAISGAGREGLAKIIDAVVAGNLDAVLVAMPSGESIMDAALALEPRRPVVIASFAGSALDAVARATAAGADLATSRPHDVERLAPMLLAAARLHAARRIAHNARGNELVLRAKLDEISDPEPRGLQPFETFQRVLELEFKRARRFEYPLSVALFAVEIEPPPPPAGIRGILRARCGNALIHTIRDIDLATQLDHERFLVLLPYTDLTGAAGLGRRVIAAVAEGDPVISSGRSFPPRVVGAVAGARPGQPLSFAKLMKDAQRALEQARRDGAELAVQP